MPEMAKATGMTWDLRGINHSKAERFSCCDSFLPKQTKNNQPDDLVCFWHFQKKRNYPLSSLKH